MFSFDESDLLYKDIATLLMFPENPEIYDLNNRLKQLTKDINTQSLQLKIVMVEKQKFYAKFKKVKPRTNSQK